MPCQSTAAPCHLQIRKIEYETENPVNCIFRKDICISLPCSDGKAQMICLILVVLIITVYKAAEAAFWWSSCVYGEDRLLTLLQLHVTVVIQLESGENRNRTRFFISSRYLFSALCDFIRSSLGLKRTPQLLLMQVTQIGRSGVLNLEPRLRRPVCSSSPSQTRNPMSVLPMIPTLSAPN